MTDYTTDTLGKIGGNAVASAASAIPGKQANLITKQAGEGSDYLTRFRQAIMGQEALPHMFTRIGDELNMPNLRTAAVGLQNQLTNLPETYSKATRGFDVNANQLGRIIGTKAAALQPAVETATNALESAQGVQGQMIAANQAEQAKQLKPYETEQSFLTDRWAREQTGFTSANQQELDGLIAKMNAGVTLSEGEKQRANQLSIAEKGYANALKIAEMNNASSEKIASMKSSSDPLGLFG